MPDLAPHASSPLLTVRDLDAFYGDIQALFGVSIEVASGEAGAVIGANGAGKSALLKSIAGALHARPDAIVFAGAPIGGLPAYAVAARARHRAGAGGQGALSFAERRGKSSDRRPAQARGTVDARGRLRPVPDPRRAPQAVEHRAVRRPAADGRHRPRADGEPEIAVVRRDQLGLAPIVVRDIYARLPAILRQGTSIVLVEQDIVQALKAAQRVYCLQEGRVALAGEAKS